MNVRRNLFGVAGAVGLAAAGATVGVARQRRAITRRGGESPAFGSLRSPWATLKSPQRLVC